MENDLKKETRKFNTWVFIITFIYALVLAFTTPVFWEEIELSFEETIILCLGMIGYLFLGLFICIVLHELGHLYYGLKSGYKFQSFKILFIEIYKQEEKIKVKFIVPVLLGQCLLNYPKEKEDVNVKNYMLGGAKFNLIFGIISTVIMIILIIFKIRIPYIITSIAWNSMYLFLSNRIPMNINGLYNDGLNAKLMEENKDIQLCIIKSIDLQKELDANKSVNEISKDLYDISMYNLPDDFIHKYPFYIVETTYRLVNNLDNPFERIVECHYRRSILPQMYRNFNIQIVLVKYLLDDIDYRGLLYDNSNKKIFKGILSKSPLAYLGLETVKYKEKNLSKQELIDSLKAKERTIDKAYNQKVENELVHNLYKRMYAKLNEASYEN